MIVDSDPLLPPTRPGEAESGRAIIWGSLAIGVLVRLVVTVSPPTPAVLYDHHEYIRWGGKMLADGLFSVHVGRPPDMPIRNPSNGRVSILYHEQNTACNYPPLSMMILYVQTRVLHALDPQLVSNTVPARLVFSIIAICCDLLVAAGCWALVRPRVGRRVAAWVFCAATLAPPMIIDSSHWGQTDAWVLAPLVWMVWALGRERYLFAGVLWGVALAIKPQGVLAAPLWGLAFLMAPGWRIVAGMLLAPLVFLAFGFPFYCAEGWAWLQRAYLENLLHAYPRTTLKAFNIWYLDLLLCESDDARLTILGLSKDLWGKILLVTGGLVFIILAWLRRSDRFRATLLFACAVMLLAVLLPTRVHERYIILPVPFLIAAAGWHRRLIWAAGPFIVAASFQMIALDWGGPYPADRWQHEQRSMHERYEELRSVLPPDDFARLNPPAEEIAAVRPRYHRDRWASKDPYREWSLTILELSSGAGCLVLLALFLFRREDGWREDGRRAGSESSVAG